jgi:hypothetical protein
MTHYQSTADIANFVLRLYFRDIVSEANHCVHDKENHYLVEGLHAVDG